MNNYQSENIQKILELRAALGEGDDVKIEEILSTDSGKDHLGHSLRFALLNYVKETKGLSHTTNAVIWAVPVLIHRNASNFLSVGGESVELIDHESKKQVLRYFGNDCRVRNLSGVVHADLIGTMEVSNQAKLFGLLAEDARFDGVAPTMSMTHELAHRIELGMEPELCFILGSVSRFNRMPVFNDRNHSERTRFAEELKGRLALLSKMRMPVTNEIEVGEICNVGMAYESGMKLLIRHVASTYKTSKPIATASSSHNFVIRFGVQDHDGRIFKRDLHLNTSLVPMDAVCRIFEFADAWMGGMPSAMSSILLEQTKLH